MRLSHLGWQCSSRSLRSSNTNLYRRHKKRPFESSLVRDYQNMGVYCCCPRFPPRSGKQVPTAEDTMPFSTGPKWPEMNLTQKLPPWWLTFIVAEYSLQASMGAKQQIVLPGYDARELQLRPSWYDNSKSAMVAWHAFLDGKQQLSNWSLTALSTRGKSCLLLES